MTYLSCLLSPTIFLNLSNANSRSEEGLRLINIAAGDQFIVGVTNGGHVLNIDVEIDGGDFKDELRALRQSFRYGKRKSEYLPQYSELKHVREHPTTFSSDPLKSIWTCENLGIMRISASFQTFVAYSVGGTSVVLMGNRSTSPSDSLTALSGLQNRNIISVVLGDYYLGALTADGTLLTWGKYSAGALGLGNPFKIPVGSLGGFDPHDDEVYNAQDATARVLRVGDFGLLPRVMR